MTAQIKVFGSVRRSRPSLKQYKRQVRGEGPGEIARWFTRSFGASSPGRFWHYWNPTYGYSFCTSCTGLSAVSCRVRWRYT